MFSPDNRVSLSSSVLSGTFSFRSRHVCLLKGAYIASEAPASQNLLKTGTIARPAIATSSSARNRKRTWLAPDFRIGPGDRALRASQWSNDGVDLQNAPAAPIRLIAMQYRIKATHEFVEVEWLVHKRRRTIGQHPSSQFVGRKCGDKYDGYRAALSDEIILHFYACHAGHLHVANNACHALMAGRRQKGFG